MKPLRFIGMVVFAILMSVNFISCNKEDVENEITIADIEGHYIAKTQHCYEVKIFDSSKCWKDQEFSREYSKDASDTFYIDITNSAVIIFPNSEFFFQIQNAEPNNLNVDDYDLPWHIEIIGNSLFLYRPYFDISGTYTLYIYELREF